MPTNYWARTDSNSANNPALNLNGDPAIEITFTWSSPTSDVGDVILEQNGGGVDPTSMVSIGGIEYSFIFEYTGTLPTQNRDGANQVPEQFEGDNVYLITVVDYPAVGESTRLAFLPDSGATAVEMDDFGKGAIDIQDLDTTPPATPVCFTKDVLIATPTGEVPVQKLKAGDQVLTASGEHVTIRWIAKSHFSWSQMLFTRTLWPVCIRKDSFGQGQPHRDLWVSPQHRISVTGWEVELTTGTEEIFVRAKHLVPEPKQPDSKWKQGVDYYHLMLDSHDIVLSNGLPSESFFPGDEALKSVGDEVRDDLKVALKAASIRNPSKMQAKLATASAYEACAIIDCFKGRALKHAA